VTFFGDSCINNYTVTSHRHCNYIRVPKKLSVNPCKSWMDFASHLNRTKLECGPMPNVMVALPNIGGNRKKTCYTRPDNMVNFGPLAAEIGSRVWGTPANLYGFCILAALLHGTLLVGVSQTLRH